jgi:hypothetical protein
MTIERTKLLDGSMIIGGENGSLLGQRQNHAPVSESVAVQSFVHWGPKNLMP